MNLDAIKRVKGDSMETKKPSLTGRVLTPPPRMPPSKAPEAPATAPNAAPTTVYPVTREEMLQFWEVVRESCALGIRDCETEVDKGIKNGRPWQELEELVLQVRESLQTADENVKEKEPKFYEKGTPKPYFESWFQALLVVTTKIKEYRARAPAKPKK